MAALSPGPDDRGLAVGPDGSPAEKTPAIRAAPRKDKAARPRVCIVVLGSGRSGTSVTARILGELGVRLNYNPTQMSDQNPDGAFEDEFIFKTHSEFFDANHSRRNLLPAGWLASELARATGAKLEAYVRKEFGSEFLWGFKDPRTSVLVPLWKRIFNRARVVPRYVICVRHPEAFVQSMANNYGIGQIDAELVWLTRTVSALRDTGLDCFILHYERLLADPLRTIRMLGKYALGTAPDPARLKAIIAECIKPKLDRAKINNIVLTNPIIPALAAALDKCEGSNFARSRLIETVQNCDRILTAFSPLIGHQQREIPEDELAQERARWRQQTQESTKRHMQRTELLLEQLAEQRAQWQQQAEAFTTAQGEETARLNDQIREIEALSAAHVEEHNLQIAEMEALSVARVEAHNLQIAEMEALSVARVAEHNLQIGEIEALSVARVAEHNLQIGEIEALSAARAEELNRQIGEMEALSAARAEELNRQIGEMEALSAARAEEAARLGADLAQAVALAAERAEEIARLGNRLTQQQAHLADSAATHAEETARYSEQIAQRDAQLTEMTQQLEQLVEQHRLQAIELKWSGTDREHLNVKVASLVALQVANRRAPSPAAQPLAAQQADIVCAEQPTAANGGLVPAQQRDGAASDPKKAEPQPNGATTKWTLRALLRAPRSYLQTWLPTR